MPHDLDSIGADDLALLLRVKNWTTVVKKEGGAAGTVASLLVPGIVETKFYETMRDRLRSELGQKGIDADVQVVPRAQGGQVRSSLLPGMAVGAGAVGLGWLLVKLARSIF